MGGRGKICPVFFLFLAVILVSATVTVALSERDPEVGACKLTCEKLRGAEQDEKLGCKQRCEKYHQEKEKKEREGEQEKEKSRHSSRGGGGSGEYGIIFAEGERDLREMLGVCQQQCQGNKGEQERPECFRTCMENEKRKGGTSRSQKGGKSDTDGKAKQQSNNPFVFEDRHFTTKLESEYGDVRVLQKFTDRSELFRSIEKYRVAILEPRPQTFIIPSHLDADELVFVANGEGTFSLVNPESRESFNIKRGDLFRVPAGISYYLMNRNDNEKLVLVKMLRTISIPGKLQPFFAVGGENKESSFFNAFSTEVLQAAFDTDKDGLERLFGHLKQEPGPFKKATEEQIRSLSGQDEGGIWPFGKRNGPYNIFRKDPSIQNDYGSLHEVDSNALPDLRELNIAFSFFNITQGSMAGPFYNTKATTVLVVPNGEGRFEMASPDLSAEGASYEKVSSRLRRLSVVVIPAGHPVVIEASNNQNLELISFELNSDEIQWFPLAGMHNVMSQWEDEALELTFGLPAKEVQKLLNKQKERLFFKAPERHGRAFA